MEQTVTDNITGYISKLRAFYGARQTRDIGFRLEMLKKLRKSILKYETELTDALYRDLRKSPEEAYLTEISIVLHEIENHIANLKRWVRPERVRTPWYLFPSTAKILFEPLGVALIIAPWNYPFQLLINPLVGAISAGCCAMLKPSPYTPAISAVMEELVRETFDPGFVSLVQGGREVNQALLSHRFDMIFFTGSPSVGKVVMKAAAEHLTPVVLELGGKSPCIVDHDANIKVAARRIAWGKTINAGQTCIAPDYLYVHESVKEELLSALIEQISDMYGHDIRASKYYPRIVNRNAADRIRKLMEHGNIVSGGEVDIEDRYIAPTIIDQVEPGFPVMQEEIFGPVLPVMTFADMDEVISYLNGTEKPLALYYFGSRSGARRVIGNTTSGGGCINDTILHVANHHLPFGGTGNSGMGRYHGKESFLAFSNRRSLLRSSLLFDNPVKYVPFRGFRFLKRFF